MDIALSVSGWSTTTFWNLRSSALSFCERGAIASGESYGEDDREVDKSADYRKGGSLQTPHAAAEAYGARHLHIV